MSAKRTKKQHFVPRFYLEHFTDNGGMVWTYDKKASNPAKDARRGTPENTAVTTNFYSVQNEDGSYNDQLEDLLGCIESDAAPLYSSLLDGKIPKNDEKDALAAFFAALYARSPALINNAAWLMGAMAQVMARATLSNREYFDAKMDTIEEEVGKVKTTKEERDNLIDFMRDPTRYKMNVLQKAGLTTMSAIKDVMDIFRKMEWIIVKSDGQHLISSDNPVVKINPDPHPMFGDGGFLMPSVFVTVPLSPNTMLEMSWKKSPNKSVFSVGRERGRLYNKHRAAFADRYVFTSRSDGGIAALVQKNKDNGLKMRMDGPTLPNITIKRKLD